jgi:hypothetical protein
MVLSLLFTVFLMQKLIVSLIKTPIIIYTDDIAVPVTEIYFPAISICSGLILASTFDRYFDYDKVKNELENGEIDFDNLTISE